MRAPRNSPSHADLDALSEEDFARIYRVNVVGAFQMVRACIEPLKAHGEGAVVNVSSIAGTHGIGSSVAYAASKGALNTMTMSLARALAPAVRVNAVCPGFVATRWFANEFGKEAGERMAAEHRKTVPLDRVAQAEDIAKVVLFFAGDELTSRHRRDLARRRRLAPHRRPCGIPLGNVANQFSPPNRAAH